MDPYCHNKSTPIPGWDGYYGMCNTAYYNIDWVNTEGNLEHTGGHPDEYSTSIIGNKTVRFIQGAAKLGKPFFVSAATRAPHGPATPAPWYASNFEGLEVMRTPAYNNTGTGHVGWVQNEPIIGPAEDKGFSATYANRWRTLLSVDDLVEAVVAEVDALGLTDKTFLFFSSDHGFHMGHLRLSSGKQHFYEFDARVPMIIAGPGISTNSTPGFLAGNVDLAPTFLELGGITPPDRMDGRSVLKQLLPSLSSASGSHRGAGGAGVGIHDGGAGAASSTAAASTEAEWRTAFLVEHSGLHSWSKGRINDCPNNTYRSLRVVEAAGQQRNMMFSELTEVSDYYFQDASFHELYDLSKDPYQLTNVWGAASPAEQQAWLKRLHTAAACKGAECTGTDPESMTQVP